MNKIQKTVCWTSLLVIILGVCLYSVLASPPMPYPVYGKIDVIGITIPLFDVTMSLCGTGSSTLSCVNVIEETKFQTDSTGSFVFSIDNINPLYRTQYCYSKGCVNGDFIKIKVCEGHPNCEVIRELKGSSLEVDFDFVSKEIVQIDKEIIKEVEKTVEIPVKEEVKVVVADEETSVSSLKALWNNNWFKGFLAMVVVLLGIGGTFALKARKMLKTTIAKNKKGFYGK